MAKQTNKQIYTALYIQIEAKIKEVINDHYPNGLPKEFYSVLPKGNIEPYIIYGAMIYTGHYDIEKPTRKDIESINNFRINFPKYEKSDIYLKYRMQGNGYTTSGAVKVDDIFKKFHTSLNEAIAESEKRIEKLKSEQALLDTGNYIRCQRCTKVVATTESKTSVIIGRGRKQVWNSWKGRMEDKACVTQTSMVFCSGECAAHEQMSREG